MTEPSRAEPLPEGEARMLPYLVEFLRRTRRVRGDTKMVVEFPWHGRRVDLATLTSSGVMSAYELKLGSFGRVLEQAMYNRLSFDRSWLVVSSVPTLSNQRVAQKFGIGVIIAEPRVHLLLPAPAAHNDPALRHRLRVKLRASASMGGASV